MDSDRRQLRSTDPAAAVRIFLARNATEVGMRAAVVSDPTGAVIAGVGGRIEMLAATGCSLLDARGVADREQLRRETQIDVTELHTVRLRVGTKPLVVSSLGAPIGAIDELAAALGRILAA
jgi:hypothetical protein